MRAVYLPKIEDSSENIVISGEKAKHLIKVLRIKSGERILILNGRGLKLLTEVSEVSKKEISLKYIKSEIEKRNQKISLLMGKVKKEALDLSIKMAVEMGVSNIYIAGTNYSQNYNLKEDRVANLIEAAMEQSNNPFLPSWKEVTLESFDFSLFDYKLCFSSVEDKGIKSSKLGEKLLLIIGPEGGFSENEEVELGKIVDRKIRLDIPIMRTPTAVACGLGYIYSLFSNP